MPEHIEDFAQVYKAIITNNDIVDGMIRVKVFRYESAMDAGPTDDYSAFLLLQPGITMTPPDVGTYGTVIFSSADRNSKVYWLGATQDRFSSPLKTNKEKVFSLQSVEGTSKISYTDGQAFIECGTTRLLASKNTAQMKQAESELTLDNEGFKLICKEGANVRSRLLLQSVAKLDTMGSFEVRTGGNVQFRLSKGNFLISGPVNPDKKLSQGEEAYNPIDAFSVKANKMEFRGMDGSINFSAGGMNIKLGNADISNAGKPGTSTFALETVIGDINIIGGSGDVLLQATNIKMVDSLVIRNGRSLMPMHSELEMNIDDLTLMAQSVPEASMGKLYIDGKKGDVLLYATKDLTLETMTKDIILTSKMDTKIDAMMNVKISSTMNTEIAAQIDAKIEALNIDIMADVQVMIQAAILDMSGANMIMAGDKTVIPSGTGPFCALPKCLFTGVNHSGSVASG